MEYVVTNETISRKPIDHKMRVSRGGKTGHITVPTCTLTTLSAIFISYGYNLHISGKRHELWVTLSSAMEV
eukprot:18685-Eustigmatos_ZCMA.PRE.1